MNAWRSLVTPHRMMIIEAIDTTHEFQLPEAALPQHELSFSS